MELESEEEDNALYEMFKYVCMFTVIVYTFSHTLRNV